MCHALLSYKLLFPRVSTLKTQQTYFLILSPSFAPSDTHTCTSISVTLNIFFLLFFLMIHSLIYHSMLDKSREVWEGLEVLKSAQKYRGIWKYKRKNSIWNILRSDCPYVSKNLIISKNSATIRAWWKSRSFDFLFVY